MGGSLIGGNSKGSSSGHSLISGKKSSAKKKGGHGFGHLVGQFGQDLVDAAVNTPGGVYALGKAGGHDALSVLSPARITSSGKTHDRGKSELRPIGAGLATATKQDVQHPLRHPGNTFLDALAVASLGAGTAARVGAAGRIARAGEGAGEVSRALVRAPKPQARVIRLDNKPPVVTGSYSKSASTRGAQKLLDKARHAYPDHAILGRSLVSKAGRGIEQERKINEGLARQGARVLRAKGKLSAGEQFAIRIQAEGVPASQRIAFEQNKLGKLTGKRLRKVQDNIKALEEAKQYLDPKGQTISNPELSSLYEEAKAVAQDREVLLRRAGLLSPEASIRRISAPGDIIDRATNVRRKFPEGSASGAAALTKFIDGKMFSESAARDFATHLVPEVFGGGEFRVPYSIKASKRSQEAIAGSGAGNMIGIARKPGSITHSFEGKILEGTGGRNDVTNLVAESNIEAQRYLHLVQAREQIAKFAVDDPNGVPDKYRVAVNVGELSKIPQSVREVLDKAVTDAKLSSEEVSALGSMYDTIRDSVFPKVKPGDLEATEGIKWVDRRLLGDLQKQNPLIGFNTIGATQRGLRVFDQINSAQKLAILYLKPAYLVPNFVGNAALALIQQGVFAPANLARAAKLNARLGVKTANAVDELMGEGITGALHDAGFLKRVNNFAAGKYGQVVDRPFRRSSFLHEAGKQGYKTKAQIDNLIFDTAKRDDLIQVVQRANSELIDYSRLGPVEKNIIARAIFFYPWVKGSTVYTARFLGEHPVTAAALAHIGALGKATQQKELGDVPSYYAGLIRTGGSDRMPRVINPTSATIFQTPADIAQAALGVAGIGPGGTPTASLTPALAAALTALTGSNSLGFNPRNESNLSTAGKALYEGLPLFQLQERLRGHQTSKSADYSERDAILKYLLGITPYTADRAKLNAQAGR